MKLIAENIQKSYKGRRVVKGVSIEVNQGEIVGLLGPNGAGKTTSFYMIVGLVKPNSGCVFLDDVEITRHAMYQRAQMGIGYLPQEVSVFRKMSIEDNIMAVLEMTKLSKQEREEKLESLIDEFSLGHVRTNLGQSLSGGEKRRTEIARALATDPKFILLDEPFAGVDPIAVEDIQKIVAKLKNRNIGVLITDHNVQETLSITDRTYLLFEGAILKAGTAEELAADEQVRKVYLGKNFELRKVNVLEDEDEEERPKEQPGALGVINRYLSNVQHTKMLLEKNNRPKINLEFADESGVKDRIQGLEGLKTLLEKTELGNRGKELLENLKLGPLESYKKKDWRIKIDSFLAEIPIVTWWVYFRYYGMLKRCKKDVDELIRNLESLKHLIENPALEKMIDEKR